MTTRGVMRVAKRCLLAMMGESSILNEDLHLKFLKKQKKDLAKNS